MPNFWEWEDRKSRRLRQAKTFLDQSKLQAANFVTRGQAQAAGVDPHSIATGPTAIDNPWLSDSDQSAIVPKRQQRGTLEEVGRTLWGGGINEVQDVLRPVARLFEYEQKYLSGPLARRIYESGLRPGIEAASLGQLDLPNQYEDLPEVVKLAGESLLSPSTWIAPQAALKYAKYLPKLAGGGLPSLGSAVASSGSRQGLLGLLESEVVRGSLRGTAVGAVTGAAGSAAAQELGLPGIIGGTLGGIAGYRLGARGLALPDRVNLKVGDVPRIINPEDMTTYHGSPYALGDLPSTVVPGQRNFASSHPSVIYSTTDPDAASNFAERWGQGKPGDTPNIAPMALKKGVKYWDPFTDEWPVGFSEFKAGYLEETTALRRGGDTLDEAGGYLLDKLYEYGGAFGGTPTLAHKYGRDLQTKLITQLARQGYKGLKSGHELAIWDKSALRPLYLADGSYHSIIGGGRSEQSDYDSLRREMEAARNRLRKADRAVDANEQLAAEDYRQRYLAGGPAPQDVPDDWGDWTPKPIDSLGDQLSDSLEAIQLLKKFKADPNNVTPADILKAQELLARRDARGGRLGGGLRLGIMEEPGTPRREAYEQLPETKALENIFDTGIKDRQQAHDYFEGTPIDITESTEATLAARARGNQYIEGLSPRSLIRQMERNQETIDGLNDTLQVLEKGRPGAKEFDATLEVYGGDLDSAKIQVRHELFREQAVQENYVKAYQKQTGPSSTGARAAGSDPQAVVDILDRMRQLPDNGYRIRSSADYMADSVARNSLTQQARSLLRQGLSFQAEHRLARQRALQSEYYEPGTNRPRANLPPERRAQLQSEIELLNTAGTWETAAVRIRDYLEKARGWRLYDDDTSFTLTEYHRELGMGQHAANAGADSIAAGINRLEQLGTFDRLGIDSYEDYVNDFNKYTDQLTPDELAASEAIIVPIGQAIKIAEAHGLEGIPSAVTTNGFYSAILPKSEVPIRQGLRTRQPVTRAQPFATQAEAEAQGIQIRDFVSAQHAFMAQLYKASADKVVAERLSPLGAKLTELQPQDLRKSLANAKYVSRRATFLDRALATAISDDKPISLRNMPPELQPLLDRAKTIATDPNLSGPAARASAYRTLRTDARAATKLVRSIVSQQQQQLNTVTQTIQRAGGTENYPIYIRELGRYFPEEVGLQLQRALEGPSSDYIQRFNNLVRPFIATMDSSFLGVQGLMGLARNPRAYSRAVIHAFSSDAYDARIREFQQNGLLDDFLSHDGVLLSRSDLGEFLRENEFSFGPTLRKLPFFKTPDSWFTRFGNAMRLELYNGSKALAEAYPEGVARDNAKRALARSASLATGFSPNPGQRWENIGLFAPRFFRAQLGLLADAVAPGSRHPLAASESRKALRNLMLGGVILTAAVNTVLGETDESRDYNWYSPYINGRFNPNFMRMRIAGQDISVFGPWDTLVRAVASTYEKGFDPGRGLGYLARSKASPAFQRLFDLASGETFAGDELQWGSTTEFLESGYESFVKQSMPISVQNVLETQSEQGLGVSSLAGLLTETLGTKTTPVSDRERRDMLALDQFNRPWRDLEPYQQHQLRQKFPSETILKARNETDKALETRRAISLRYAQEQADLDASEVPGPEWLEAYHDLRRRQAGAFDQWEQEHLDLANDLNRRAPGSPGEAALDSYYGLFRESNENNWSPDETSRALDRLEESWTPEQKSYVSRNTGLRDTPIVKEYKAARAILDPYFGIEDQVWDRLNNRPGLTSFDDYSSWYKAESDRLIASGVPLGLVRYRMDRLPLVRQMNATTRDLKERYRQTHPDADRELVKWYGATPIRLQR